MFNCFSLGFDLSIFLWAAKKTNSFEYWRFRFGCILLTISYLDPVPSEEYMGYDNSGGYRSFSGSMVGSTRIDCWRFIFGYIWYICPHTKYVELCVWKVYVCIYKYDYINMNLLVDHTIGITSPIQVVKLDMTYPYHWDGLWPQDIGSNYHMVHVGIRVSRAFKPQKTQTQILAWNASASMGLALTSHLANRSRSWQGPRTSRLDFQPLGHQSVNRLVDWFGSATKIDQVGKLGEGVTETQPASCWRVKLKTKSYIDHGPLARMPVEFGCNPLLKLDVNTVATPIESDCVPSKVPSKYYDILRLCKGPRFQHDALLCFHWWHGTMVVVSLDSSST
jgi:hypothetical protein